MHFRFASVAGLALLSSTALLADFQYEQTTRITGGFLASMARFAGKKATDPVTTTVMVKGNRMATVSPSSTQVIDLDKETIATVDHDKKTYSVMTFEQMKQSIEDAMRELDKNAATGQGLQFQAAVKETGQGRDVNGVAAREFILTMSMTGKDQKSGESGAMHITNDMWMAPAVPGYDEVRRFHERMAQKLGNVFQGMNPVGMMRPQMGKGLAEMAKEMAKLTGVPVMQVTRMGSTADGRPLPAASQAPELSKQSEVEMPNAGEVAGKAADQAAQNAASSAAQKALGRFGGLGGGLGGFGRRKKDQAQEPAKQEESARPPASQGPGGGLMMETTTEMRGFSSAAVDSSKFDIPAGYKQVEPDLGRGRRR